MTVPRATPGWYSGVVSLASGFYRNEALSQHLVTMLDISSKLPCLQVSTPFARSRGRPEGLRRACGCHYHEQEFLNIEKVICRVLWERFPLVIRLEDRRGEIVATRGTVSARETSSFCERTVNLAALGESTGINSREIRLVLVR